MSKGKPWIGAENTWILLETLRGEASVVELYPVATGRISLSSNAGGRSS